MMGGRRKEKGRGGREGRKRGRKKIRDRREEKWRGGDREMEKDVILKKERVTIREIEGGKSWSLYVFVVLTYD